MVIKKTSKGYVLYSLKTGKRLGGPYPTKQLAQQRENQIHYFKLRQKRRR